MNKSFLFHALKDRGTMTSEQNQYGMRSSYRKKILFIKHFSVDLFHITEWYRYISDTKWYRYISDTEWYMYISDTEWYMYISDTEWYRYISKCYLIIRNAKINILLDIISGEKWALNWISVTEDWQFGRWLWWYHSHPHNKYTLFFYELIIVLRVWGTQDFPRCFS